jgi:tape measure domain-containing protein
MSSTVDNRVVEMGFNNSQFEKGVKQSTESLGQLKKSLDLTEGARNLSNLDAAGKNVDISHIAEGVDKVKGRFSALGVIGMTVLMNLTNAAIEYGKKMLNGFLEPMKQGFEEYETQMNAIQTVLANTESKGTTLDDVKEALNELNTYADKTIYNFTEMTRNIGTFTAAGVDLETSVAAIKGIANLAAVSGSNSQQAATAMYQLSQALSSGTVKLMDWNSVVNAGMGGQVFQEALKETARIHGIAIDDMIEQEGSFRETLASGWLTSEVLLDTLQKFTGDLNEQQLEAMGYTEDQIEAILKLGQTANDAATKVKTFTQLKDTLQEARGSGWTQTWQLIIGDFEEAKALFTEISDELGAMIGASSDARNAVVQSWRDQGGRDAAIQTLRNSFEALTTAMGVVGDAWRSVFPPGDLGGKLAEITKGIEAFSARLIMSEETADKVQNIFQGLFSILGIGKDILEGLLGPLQQFVGGISVDGGGVLDFLDGLADRITEFRNIGNIAESVSTGLYSLIEKVREFGVEVYYALEFVKEKIQEVRDWFNDIFEGVDFSPVSEFFDKVELRFEPFTALAKGTVGILGLMLKAIAAAIPYIFRFASFVGEFIGGLADSIYEGMKGIDFVKVFDVINTGLIGALLLAIRNFVSSGGGLLDSAGSVFEGVTDILDGVRGSLEAYQQNLKAKTLLMIAIAVGILAAALVAISLIDSAKLTLSLGIITGLFVDLIGAMAAFGKLGGGGVLQSFGLIALASALLLLSVALGRLAAIDAKGMQRGLGAIYALTATMIIFSKLISGVSTANVIKGAVALGVYSFAILLLAQSVKSLGAIDQAELTRGLLGVGALLAEVAVFMRLIGEGGASVKAGIAMIGMAAAIMLMAQAVQKFGEMDVAVLQQGLVTMGVIFAEIAAFTRLVGDPKRMISTAISVTIIAAAMYILVDVMTRLGRLSWEEIGKGLVGIGGALLIIAAAVRALPSNMLLQSIALVAVAGAIAILGKTLEQMGQMDWIELGKGLLALAGSLLVITVALYAMSGTLAGSAALLVAAGALWVLAGVMQTLGNMGLAEIGIALLALVGIFVVLGLAGLLLTPLVPTLLGLGASMFLIGAGAALIGAGLFLFATGLSLLAASGMAAALAIVGMVTTILGLIPVIINTLIDTLIVFAEGIIRATPVVAEAITGLLLAFLQIIIDTAPKLYEALDVLLTTLIQLIIDHVPDFIEAVILLLLTLLEEIAAKLPDFIQAGFDILIGFLEGIRDNIGEVVTVAIEIVTEFLDAVAEKIPDIIDSGWNLMLSFIEGLTESVEDNLHLIIAAIGDLAAAIIDGLVRGIADGAGAVIGALVGLALDAWNAAKRALGVESPSKKFIYIGEMLIAGLAKGIKGSRAMIPAEIKKVAKDAADGMTKVVAAIADGIDTDMDMNPTIRPIVDMSDVIQSGLLVDDIFGNKSMSLATAAVTSSKVPVAIVDSEGNPVGATSIQMTQNNYSPKALSRIEIYRQTRNQLRGVKGLLNS